jgi:hypothetical protein
MTATPSIQVSQGDVNVISSAAGNIQISQADTTAVYNFPAEEIQTSQVDVQVSYQGASKMQVSQVDVIAIVKGRVDDPSVRAWTYTLDGHDFYVLRLGNDETLVYDVASEQWSVYTTSDFSYWSVYTGANWVGGNNFAETYGSNVIVGSDSNGVLFFLDPTKPEDDPLVEDRDIVPFLRRITGQLISRGYNYNPLYEVQLLGSLNQENLALNLDVELFYSDDRGDSYVSAGKITTVPNDYTVRGSWRSLGSFTSPGRLIRIEDRGALARIDSITVNLGEAEGGA